MIFNATSGYDFNEEDVQFLNIIARKARDNILVDITDLEEITKEMEKEKISPEKFDDLCKKMQDNQILEYHNMGGHRWITINSLSVTAFKARLKKISCPKCHKRPLKKKIVTYCPDCGYEAERD